MRIVRLGDVTFPLLSHELLHADICEQQLCMMTREGDLLVYGDRDTLYQEGYCEQEHLRRVNTLTRFSGDMRAMCFAERVGRGVMLVVS